MQFNIPLISPYAARKPATITGVALSHKKLEAHILRDSPSICCSVKMSLIRYYKSINHKITLRLDFCCYKTQDSDHNWAQLNMHSIRQYIH